MWYLSTYLARCRYCACEVYRLEWAHLFCARCAHPWRPLWEPVALPC